MRVITVRKRSLGQGNVFTPVCQSFCSHWPPKRALRIQCILVLQSCLLHWCSSFLMIQLTMKFAILAFLSCGEFVKISNEVILKEPTITRSTLNLLIDSSFESPCAFVYRKRKKATIQQNIPDWSKIVEFYTMTAFKVQKITT